MPGDRLLDFDGRDVLATRNNNVLLTVAQFDIAIGMPYTDIARMEPATSKCLSGCIRILKVALHNVVAVHHHLAHRLTIARHIVHRLIDDTYAIGGHIALALPGEEARLLSRRQRVPFLVPFTNGIRTIGLGQSIDVNGT